MPRWTLKVLSRDADEGIQTLTNSNIDAPDRNYIPVQSPPPRQERSRDGRSQAMHVRPSTG